MRIIQVTDLHVRGVNEKIKGEEDTRANLFLILQHLISLKYDLLCLTGDLCLDKPRIHIYEWIKEQLSASIDIKKMRVVAGNHDDTQMMSTVLCPEYDVIENELYYQEKIGDHSMIFLDTGKGYASDGQKKWLIQLINAWNGDNVIIFMHHPPLIAGVNYMDKNYALEDMKDFQSIFKKYPEKRFHVFCGHYHNDRVVSYDNVTVYITPSCYVQIDSVALKFTPDHYDIGYRIIDLLPQNKVMTEVRYLL